MFIDVWGKDLRFLTLRGVFEKMERFYWPLLTVGDRVVIVLFRQK